jgi:hypothetical protein
MDTGTDYGDRRMTSTYVAVVIVEAAVLLALWVFGRYFGSH